MEASGSVISEDTIDPNSHHYGLHLWLANKVKNDPEACHRSKAVAEDYIRLVSQLRGSADPYAPTGTPTLTLVK